MQVTKHSDVTVAPYHTLTTAARDTTVNQGMHSDKSSKRGLTGVIPKNILIAHSTNAQLGCTITVVVQDHEVV